MCRRIECEKCGRPSFTGCGAHVEQVLRDVPADERCKCREDKAREQAAAEPGGKRPWIRALFGK